LGFNLGCVFTIVALYLGLEPMSQLITNRKSYIGFRFVHTLMTLNDPEQSKRICNNRKPKTNLVRAQRLDHVSFTNRLVLFKTVRTLGLGSQY